MSFLSPCFLYLSCLTSSSTSVMLKKSPLSYGGKLTTAMSLHVYQQQQQHIKKGLAMYPEKGPGKKDQNSIASYTPDVLHTFKIILMPAPEVIL